MEKDQMVLHNLVLVNDSLPRAIYLVVDERAGLDNVQHSRISSSKSTIPKTLSGALSSRHGHGRRKLKFGYI